MPEAPLSVRNNHVSRLKHLGLSKAGFVAALLLCGLFAGYLLAHAMQNGMGISSDSIAYIGVSEHIVAGKGLNWIAADGSLAPMTHFPPMYPLLLAIIQMTGLNSIEAAKLINILTFSAGVILIGWFIRRLSGDPIAALMGSLLAVFSPILIISYHWAMTESLFIFFMLLGIALLIKYIDTKKLGLLIIVGILFSMHYLTRYAGLSIIVAATIAILLQRKFNLQDKIRSLLILLFFSLAPMAIWVGRNMYLAGTFTNRRIIWHPPSLPKLKRIFWIMWEWISSNDFTSAAKIGMVVFLFLGFVVIVIYCLKLGKSECLKRISDIHDNHALTVLIMHVFIYSLLILATITLFDASTPLDLRITLPVYVVLLILLPTSLALLARNWINSFRFIPLFVICGLLLVSYVDRATELVEVMSEHPLGIGSQMKLKFSDLEKIRELPPEIVIYTNNIEGLYFQFGRYGHRTPIGFDDVTMLEKPQYTQELSEMRELLESERAVLVLFYTHIREMPSEWIDGLEKWWEHQGTVLYAVEGFYDHIP